MPGGEGVDSTSKNASALKINKVKFLTINQKQENDFLSRNTNKKNRIDYKFE